MAKCPSKYDASPNAPVQKPDHAKPAGHRVVVARRCPASARSALLAAFVVAALRGDDLRRRRAAPLDPRSSRAASAPSTWSTALLALASAVLVHAFVADDYSIKYVAANSDAAQPLFYRADRVLGRARRLDPVLGRCCCRSSRAVAIRVNRETQRELIPYVVAIIAVVEMFFLFLMMVHNNPFETFLADVPARRPRHEPAAADAADGHPSAVALHRLRRA